MFFNNDKILNQNIFLHLKKFDGEMFVVKSLFNTVKAHFTWSVCELLPYVLSSYIKESGFPGEQSAASFQICLSSSVHTIVYLLNYLIIFIIRNNLLK